jgi:DNA polymerase-3 subunit delta'
VRESIPDSRFPIPDYIPPMPIVPLYGHETLRRQLAAAVRRAALPASLVIHGPRGIGKQRLALWLGQLLLCERSADEPCGECVHCRHAAGLAHPDLRWFFPRERLTTSDVGRAEVEQDIAEGITERREAHGLYARPSGKEAIYVATVRALVQLASLTPTLARRKIFVIGDADRMVAQEGSDQAANAFLKLLEEPPADTTIMLTTSEPGALLPTIRSRVIAMRAAPLPDRDMRAFLADPLVAGRLGASGTGESALRQAAGAPGTLLQAESQGEALAAAQELLTAAGQGRAAWSRAALAAGASGARGKFTEMLDALLLLLADDQRAAVAQQNAARALAISEAVDAVEKAKERASGNANPQLLAAALIPPLAAVGGP